MSELEAKQWIRQILGALQTGASLTPNTLDDKLINAILQALDNGVIWAWVWKMINPLLNDAPPITMVPSEEAVQAELQTVGFSPIQIALVIKAILALIESLRKR